MTRCAGAEAADWDTRIQEAREAVNFQANAMASAYGQVLNVTTDDILWGMGQVIIFDYLFGFIFYVIVPVTLQRRCVAS